VLGQQPLQVCFGAILDQTRVHAELMVGVMQHLVQLNPEAVVGLGVLDHPDQNDAVGDLVILGEDLGHRTWR